MAKYYPHKQTLTIAIVCILAVGATTAYTYWQPAPPSSQNLVVQSTDSIQQDIIGTTTTDWKKQFFDVTGSNTVIKTTAGQVASDTPLTLTDKVGRDFFARYIELKQNNLDGNKQLVQGVIDQTLANAQVESADTKIYTQKDISIIDAIDAQTIHTYANTVAGIIITFGPKKNATDIAYDAFNKNDLSMLNQIDPVITAYKKISQTLIATPVPKPLVQNHLDLINSINSMVSVSQALRNIEGDPMQSIVSLSKYVTVQGNILSALLSMQDYFKLNKIAFIPTESGAFFSLLKPQ
ncbi:MAG: hypothetical protein PHG25_03015 [Candidatus Pacebacteria bacterium]|nr:hypothetical protein [Candidatus Paceibacterota bacterium]